MQISTRKAIWWYALAAGVGASLMFVYLLVLDPRIPGKIYSWPIATVVLSIVAVFRLRASYRDEPGPTAGFWQLSISDLLVVALFCGLLLAIFQQWTPRQFLSAGIPFSFVTGAHLVAGMLVATRRGLQQKAKKYAFAFGFVLRNYGALGVGTGVVLVLVILTLGEAHNVGDYILCTIFLSDRPSECWFYYPVRAGICMLPPGLLLCWWGRSEAGRLIE